MPVLKETRGYTTLNATAEVCKKSTLGTQSAGTRFSVHSYMCPRWWAVMVKKQGRAGQGEENGATLGYINSTQSQGRAERDTGRGWSNVTRD